jgi:hypothetical protein
LTLWNRVKRLAFGDLRRAFIAVHADLQAASDRALHLAGAQAAIALRGLERVETLSDAGFKVTSQHDEDGILEWLLQKIPVSRPLFVEFGVTNYQEANTRFLLHYRNWKGLVMDGSPEMVEAILATPDRWQHDLTAKAAWVTAENINGLIGDAGFVGRIGLLSVDIDGNDYWVWKAIEVVDPDIVICEYNGVYGDLRPIATPYRADFARHEAHHSGLYYGSSVRALEHLGEQKGYRLVGSNRGGNNAFFVRNDLFQHVADRIGSTRARPSLYRESHHADGRFSYLGGLDRARAIAELPVVSLDTGETAAIGAAAPLYSPAWLAAMGV